MFHYLNMIQCLRLTYTENSQCADTQASVSVKRGGRYTRDCESGHRKVSVVRIKRFNFTEKVCAFCLIA